MAFLGKGWRAGVSRVHVLAWYASRCCCPAGARTGAWRA